MGKKIITVDSVTGKKTLETIVDSLENAKGKDTVAYSAKAVDGMVSNLEQKKANKSGDISTDFNAKNINISGNIIPNQAGLNIGDPNNRFSSIYVDEAYLSTNTLYLGDTPIMGTEKDTIMIKSDRDQSINVKTTGVGSTKIISESNVELSTSGSNADVIVQATGQGSRAVLSANNSVDMNAKYVNMTGDVTITGPMRTKGLTIDGDLIVNGDTVTVNSQTIQTKDNIIEVNYGQVGNGVTAGQAGIKVNRGDSAPYYMIFDESDDMFKVGMVGSLQTIASQKYVLDNKYSHPETHPANMITGLAKIATSGSYVDLTNKPTSLPANGGNADTIDGKHASDFLPSTWLPANDHVRKHSITSVSDHSAGNWKLFYSNATGQIVEMGLGSAGQVLKSNGTSSAPTWQTDNDTKYTVGSGLTLNGTQFAHDSSLKHIPNTESANNSRFLRNDNTWQTITPENIKALRQVEIPSGGAETDYVKIISFNDTPSGNIHAEAMISGAGDFGSTNHLVGFIRVSGRGNRLVELTKMLNHSGGTFEIGYTRENTTTHVWLKRTNWDGGGKISILGEVGCSFERNLVRQTIVPSGYTIGSNQKIYSTSSKPTANEIGAIAKSGSVTTNNVAVFNDTTGNVKDSGFTIGKSVPSNAVFTDTNTWRPVESSPTTSTENSISSSWAKTHQEGTGVNKHIPSGGTASQYLKGDGTWGTPANTASASANILNGSNSGTQITYAPYAAQQNKLSFDTSTTNPTRTDRLNLNGNLHATKVYSGGTEVEIKGHTHNYSPVHDHPYDNYNSWNLKVNSEGSGTNINSKSTVNIKGSGATTVSRSGNDITIGSTNTTYSAGTGLTLSGTQFTHDSNLKHIPTPETANNAKFLRNDNTWQTVTPGNIGALGVSATAEAAKKLAIARTISLSGDVTGSTSFDGSGNVNITTTVANDSHTHDNTYYTKNQIDNSIKPKNNTLRSNLGDPSVAEMALIDAEATNKIWFHDTNLIKFEDSANGSEWTTKSVSTDQIKKLVSGKSTAEIPMNKGQYLRITIKPIGYVFLNWLYMYFSTSGDSASLMIEKKKASSANWETHVSYTNTANTWPGHLFLSHASIPFSTDTNNASHYNEVRITIKANAKTNSSETMTLYGLEWWGGYPAGKRTIYDWDENKNVTFPANVKTSGNVYVGSNAVYHAGNKPTPSDIGAVDSTGNIVANRIAIFSDAAGNIKDSGFTIGKSVPNNAVFTDTTYNVFTKSSNGLVPQPGGSSNTRYLREDGTWVIPTNTNTASATSNILAGSNNGTQITYAPYSIQQDKLSFDTGITNPTRTDRLNLNGSLYATQLYDNGKRVSTDGHTHNYDNYGGFNILANSEIAGTKIASNGNLIIKSSGATSVNRIENTITISSTNTTYSAGSGLALSGTQFTHDSSLKHVPTPETANNAKFLRNDNTWQTVTPANIGAVDSVGTIVANKVAIFSDTAGNIKDSGFTIGKSVPSNAVFTDTNTWRPLGTTANDAAAGNHNHTSLTGLTSLRFNSDASDSASIVTTIDNGNTYFDFNLADDLSQNDQWRWRFTPSGGTIFDAMKLNPIAQGKADLYVSGTKVSLEGHTHAYDNYGGFNVKANAETTGTKITSNGDLVIKSSGATSISRSAGTFTISSTDTNTASAVSNLLAGSNSGTQITYAPYTTQQARLSFDTSATNPTRTDRLNLNGYLYASKLYSAGTEVEIKGHSHANDHARKHSMTSNSDHSANNWKMFYSNGSGQVVEMGLGNANQILKFNGNSAPTAVNEYELNITTLTKSLTLSTEWQDTGIEGTALATGSYMVQIAPTDNAITSQYSEYYTGTMSWYSGATNSTETDEIALHKAGHAPNGSHIYLRVARNTEGLLKLQVAYSKELSTVTNVTFKFKRMI